MSWLPLKLDSMETEQEVLDRFFTDKTPSNLQKKQTARKVRKPEGSARFDPLSMERHGMEEWKEIWEDQDQAKKEKEEKKKETDTDPQSSSNIWFVNSLVLQSFWLNDLPPVLTFQSFLMTLRKLTIV